MRTRQEILEKIAKEKEEKRKSLVNWAIQLVEQAMEAMYVESKTSYSFEVKENMQEMFEKASIEPEVVEVLKELEFTTTKGDIYPRLTFYLTND